MSNESYNFAFETALNELQSVCPELSPVFIFKDDLLIAKNENSDEKTGKSIIDTISKLKGNVSALGELETITIQSSKCQINISRLNDFFIAHVSSKKIDNTYIKTLLATLISTVIRFLERFDLEKVKSETAETIENEAKEDFAQEEGTNLEPDVAETTEEAAEETEDKQVSKAKEIAEQLEEQKETSRKLEVLPEPPITQLMVENLSGLLVASDTVRIDSAIITSWTELYGEKQIEEVDLESLNGQTTRCKFREIKSSKHEGKGIIRMPEKIQRTLEISKGELVMIKPVIE